VLKALLEMVVGAGVGIAVGGIGGLLLLVSLRRGWSSGASRRFATIALALLAYSLALLVEGNGFIAAFVGGVAFGAATAKATRGAVEYAEETGTLMTLGVWFIFGAAIAPGLISDGLRWEPIVYAVVSLTVVRMLAVVISLVRRKMHWSSLVFMGWFGPRGLASVAFLILALEWLQEYGYANPLIVATAGWTILLSVVLHGFSAGPVATWYSRKAASFAPGSPELQESVPVKGRGGITSPSAISTETDGGR